MGGEVVRDPARDVTEADAVAVDGRPVALERRHVMLALNKPAGYVSTVSDPQGRPTVVSLVQHSRERLYPVGRLDAETTGLILLTNDGELAYRLTHPSFEVARVYRAHVRRPPVREPALRRLREGVLLDDGMTAPAGARRLTPERIEITLHEGRKRQVRRMLDAVGHPVVSLERVAFGPLRLGDLPPGRHRRAQARRDRGAAQAHRAAGPAPARTPLDSCAVRLIALRGANTVAANEADAILDATEALMHELLGPQRARDRRPRLLPVHAHARPRRGVPRRRRAADGAQPRAADVRAGDRRARRDEAA